MVRFARVAALASCLTMAVTAAAAQPAEPIRYTVSAEAGAGDSGALVVELRFRGDADGSTVVWLPNRWSGAHDLHRAVVDLTVDGAKTRRDEPAVLTLTHAPNAPVVLRYRVVQDFAGDPAAGSERPFRPTTRPGWFTAVGWTLFAEVDGRGRQPVEFAWGERPQGWTVASDLDHPDPDRKVLQLLDSVLVGGADLKIVERRSHAGTVRVAVHGAWRFEPQALTELVGRVADASADFWGDRDERFFVAVTPLKAGPADTIQYGLGLGDAFALWAAPGVTLDQLRHIVAHEHQHAWVPGRIGGVRSGAQEALDYWFSEGLTDFYTHRLLLRAGEWSPEAYAADLNRVLRAYAASPARDQPNRIIPAAFWNDQAVAELPYQRGMLLALLWDERMRRASGGTRTLDDVVRTMRAMTWGSGPARLQAAYAAAGGGDLGEDLARYVEAGERVLLPSTLYGGCLVVRDVEVPLFDRGFDAAATRARGGVVAGVAPESPAYAAGLRDGMRLLMREGGVDEDPSVEMIYRVADGASERMIRWLPQGARTVRQEVSVAHGLSAEQYATCAQRLGGAGV